MAIKNFLKIKAILMGEKECLPVIKKQVKPNWE